MAMNIRSAAGVKIGCRSHDARLVCHLSSRLEKRNDVSVAIRETGTVLPIKVVLHPTDFSELSQWAATAACRLARDYQARLVIVHVVPTGSAALATLAEMGGNEKTENLRDSYQRYLHDIRLPHPEVPVEYRLEDGDPAAVIIQLAMDIQADVIVMGTHGRRGLGHLLIGSVTEQVIRQAPCPVFTMRNAVAADADRQT